MPKKTPEEFLEEFRARATAAEEYSKSEDEDFDEAEIFYGAEGEAYGWSLGLQLLEAWVNAPD